jgi:nitrogen fixation NifU-like protein
MTELCDLYQELILDHGRRPRNHGDLPDATQRARGYNPLCGDQFTVELALDGDVVRDVRFTGRGCAISTASASLMTQAVKGRPAAEVKALFERFRALVTSPDGEGDGDAAALGKLAVFEGVRRFPTRVKCATLAWHALRAALDDAHDVVTTE